MTERNLYEVTGDIKDINTMLVSREEWNRRAQPQQAEAVPQWQPIETAPKDGTVVDLWHSEFGRMPGWFWGLPHHCCGEMGSLCDSDWHSLEPGWVDEFNEPHSVDVDATHWMPLPAAPQPKEQSNG